MSGEAKSDKGVMRDGGSPRNDAAGTEPEAELADQVERVVSLLHKLESLYAQTPPKEEAAPLRRHASELDAEVIEDDFLERFAVGGPERASEKPPGTARPERDAWRPPPVPGPEAARANADPAFWYKGALRQHEHEVKDKPNFLTKVGLGFAAVLAVILTLPWLVPAAFGPDWRRALDGVEWTGPAPAPGSARPNQATAARGAEPAADVGASAPWTAAVKATPPARETATGGAQDDPPDAAPSEVAAMAPAEPAPAPQEAVAPADDTASKTEAWRAAALQAIFDQRAAWAKAKETGEWTGIAKAPPVVSRTFGEFEPPPPSGEAPLDAESGQSVTALDGGSLAEGGAPVAVADTCETAQVEADQKVVRLNFGDPSRAGSQTELVVNDVTYRSVFGADGRLGFEAPRLDETAVVRWVQRDGSVCQRTVPRQAADPLLQVAVLWSGDLGFELDVVEPHSWPGSPTGYITSMQPNSDGSHGAGTIQTFGKQGDLNRALVYAVPTEKIGSDGVLNVQVKLSPRAEGGGNCGASAEVFTNAEIAYEVFIIQDDGPSGRFQRENKSFAFNVPPCGATASQQRIERLSVRF